MVYDAAYANIKFNKYDSATNTLIQKATRAVSNFSSLTYESSRQVFIGADGFLNPDVVIFNPTTDTVTTFATTVNSTIGQLVYVPQKGKIYGVMGTDGAGQYYIGYIDLDLNIVVNLGVVPTYLTHNVSPYNLVYSPVSDSLYGAWTLPAHTAVFKFNLATNIGSHVLAGTVGGYSSCWDSDRGLLLVTSAPSWKVFEVDTATDTLATTSTVHWNCPLWSADYDSSLRKMVGAGYYALGNGIVSYDTLAGTGAEEFIDYDYSNSVSFGSGSFLAAGNHLITAEGGIRKICVS